ncbi:MAG: sugar transferase [bacterium]|nr:sugar transferase [bacterium]
MNSFSKLKQLTLLTGDVAVLYAALILALTTRYGKLAYFQLFHWHLEPFTIIFALWLVIYYIAGLYDLKSLKNDLDFWRTFWYAALFGAGLAALFFYLIPFFQITPRANLFIFLAFYSILALIWRGSFNRFIGQTGATHKILMVGTNKITEELVSHLKHNPQLGYEIKFEMREGLGDKEFEHLSQIILANNINTIIIPAHLKKDARSAKLIYQTLLLGIEVLELSTLYELIFKKVPLTELEEVWFLENLVKKHRIYEFISNPLEQILALILVAVLLPLGILIAILIKLSSAGPVIFRQVRIGQSEREFTLYKFRTMPVDAEKDGPQWANYHQDPRATLVGRILRKSHLDELPQLLNILKGELSFVGPRPERPNFVADLKKELPYYDLRHLVKPGVTGWAQINFRYAASAMDSYQKLQYDIYYLKNNSPLLDFLIILRTIKFLITNLK